MKKLNKYVFLSASLLYGYWTVDYILTKEINGIVVIGALMITSASFLNLFLDE